jgi:hypothetical protein
MLPPHQLDLSVRLRLRPRGRYSRKLWTGGMKKAAYPSG